PDASLSQAFTPKLSKRLAASWCRPELHIDYVLKFLSLHYRTLLTKAEDLSFQGSARGISAQCSNSMNVNRTCCRLSHGRKIACRHAHQSLVDAGPGRLMASRRQLQMFGLAGQHVQFLARVTGQCECNEIQACGQEAAGS